MRRFVLSVCCVCIVSGISPLCAQNLLDNGNLHPAVFAPNAVYIESFGNGLGVTLNYERRFSEDFSLRYGIGTAYVNSITYGIPYPYYNSSTNQLNYIYNSVMNTPNYIFSTVALGNYWLNFGSSHVTIGAGAALFSEGIDGASFTQRSYSYEDSPRFWATFNIAYRYQPREGGFLFEAAFTPLWSTPLAGTANQFIPYAGISAGYSF